MVLVLMDPVDTALSEDVQEALDPQSCLNTGEAQIQMAFLLPTRFHLYIASAAEFNSK